MTHTLIVAGDVVGARMAGTGIRSFELARALHAAGVPVTLAHPGREALGLPFPDLPYGAVGVTGGGDAAALRSAAARAGAIVAGGMVLARLPFLAALDVPIAVDLYGPYVLENLPAGAAGGPSAEGRARRHAGDVAALALELSRGDFFLCASERQRDYWLGALAALGRVNPATYAPDPTMRRLVDVVPFGLPDIPPSAGPAVLRGVVPGIAGGDRIVLWAGGLWDWLDPFTLIRAVAAVDRRRPDVRLCFMGGQSPSANVPAMAAGERARNLAQDLGVAERVVFFQRDWVPYAARASYLLEADIGASFHHDHIETRFAFRTRLLDYVWSGLPMLVTGGDVLGDEAAARGVGSVVPPGDVDAAAAALSDLLDAPDGRAACAPAFEAWRAELAWSRAILPLASFLAAPRRAPDRPSADGAIARLAPTPLRRLPNRAMAVWREGGPLLVLEETARWLRWRARPR